MTYSARLRYILSGVVLVSPLIAAASVAQEAPTSDISTTSNPVERDVVVIGHSAAKARKATRRIISVLTRETREGQVVRWADRDQVCLTFSGLEKSQEKYFFDKISQEAARVQVTITRGNCDALIHVVFTTDSPRLQAEITKAHLNARNLPSRDGAISFRNSGAPVKWLYSVDSRGADGRPAGDLVINGQAFKSFQTSIPSRLRSASQNNFTGLLILVDTKRLRRTSNQALGDYLTMISLTVPPLALGFLEGVDTILNMFVDDSNSRTYPGLTEWDKAYLTALYQVPINTSAASSRSQILSKIDNLLAHRRKKNK